ncbi:uncharacterized protein LOC106468980 [Limulus polyphemus]|uniref:Uncharacterized protein LOC106468980 n=1 Tax=Limulus polyphemus TaxID=6850 RepID=A0ABM1BMA9_LIMPO|nr:uncharacterized protein LOC106468980 [Limulus polyphemus]
MGTIRTTIFVIMGICLIINVFGDKVDHPQSSMVQKPIDSVHNSDQTREIGATCRYSNDCKSGCCLYSRKTEKRTCQKMALKGESCTSGQIKLNSYVDFCPCEKGNKFCEYPDNICKE